MLLIGLDEAGYGPNLGPLVVAATVWDVPGDAAAFDPWAAFAGVVSRAADPTGGRVRVADSKAVHASAAGAAALERSAVAILRLFRRQPASLFALWDDLAADAGRAGCGEPWFLTDDLPLPLCGPVATEPGDRWAAACDTVGVRPVAVAAAVVPAAAFNRGVVDGGKGRLLSRTTFALLRRVWDGSTPALVLADKHGGRDRYADLLAAAFPEHLPLCLAESRAESRYRVGPGEVRIAAKSENHLPVAAASLVAKYLREAAMAAFNRFWLDRVPGLRPTAGYPVDAGRFLTVIEPHAAALGLPRETYWRSR